MLVALPCYQPTVRSGALIEQTFRDEAAAVLATLIRLLGDFDRAEEALQEAIVAALETWDSGTRPESPGAWLLTTARRKAIDRLRREGTALRKQDQLVAVATLEAEELARTSTNESPIPDDMLRLIFCCCHPALAADAQVALTLRTVCGLSTAEIARSFLLPEPTIAQRIVRAKKKIRAARIPYRVPEADELHERLDAALRVVYLIFNEGYFASFNADLVRSDLCDEAIDLARTIERLVPGQPEIEALLALLLLQDSRRHARVDEQGELVLLAEQDRDRWNTGAIEEGRTLVQRALARGRVGPYQLQAAIAAVHSEALVAEETDWIQIAGLYQRLRQISDSAVVRLNQIVAIGMVEGPQVALQLLESVGQELSEYQSFHAARADFALRAGDYGLALEAYTRAWELSENPALARYCGRRMEQCRELMARK